MIERLTRYPLSLVWILFAYGWAIWLYCVPFTGDEKVYLSIAMEMRAHGDWLHPWLLGEHSYYKPPLQFWATLLGWKVFGLGLVGAFLPSALATVATAACVGWIAKRALGQHHPTAPLWFAASAGTLTYGTTAQMEIWIVVLYSFAWGAALEYAHECERRWPWIFLALLSAGLLSAVKSPLYSVLWVFGFWLYLGLRGDWNVFRRLEFWLAHGLGAAAGAAWFIYALTTDRARFWSDYVVRETLAKTTGNSSSIGHMWADFSTFCIPFLLPLICLVVLALRPKRLKTPPSQALWPLILGWGALPAVFFSAFPYRTETYLYLLIPLGALLMDLRPMLSSREMQWLRAATRVNGIIMLVAGILIAWIAAAAGMIPGACAVEIALLAVSYGVVSFLPLDQRRWQTLALLALALIFAIRLGAITLGRQDIAGLHEVLQAHPGRDLVFLDPGGNIWHETGLLSVAAGRPGIRALNLTDFEANLRTGAIGVLGDGEWPGALPTLERDLSARGVSFEQQDWWRWKRAFQVPSPRDLMLMSGRDEPDWREHNQREYMLVWLRGAGGR
jgi:4-amino-4-deoxy-L-arabinose transferase-like glycosyltransferase